MSVKSSLTVAIVCIIIIGLLATAGLFYFGINLSKVTKSYEQTSAELSTAQDSLTALNNQLALQSSDLRGLRAEKRELQNQLAAMEQTFAKKLRELQLKYESALTRGENLRELGNYYYGFKLQLEVAEAREAEWRQKYDQSLAELWQENFQLKQQLARRTPQ